jgi:hypothetical protein
MRDPAGSHAIGSTGFEESSMTHDTHDPNGESHASSQGIFIGWLAVGLLVLMGVFALTVIGAGATHGFS